MKTQEILSIVALSLLGSCLLCGLAKMAMKGDSAKKNCDKACSMAVFAAVVLLAISQLIGKTDGYEEPSPSPAPAPGVIYCSDGVGGQYADYCYAGHWTGGPGDGPGKEPSHHKGWEGSSCAVACLRYANWKTCGGSKSGKNCEKDSDCSNGTCKYVIPKSEDRVAFCKKNFRLDDWNRDNTGKPQPGIAGGCATDSKYLAQYWGRPFPNAPFQYNVCRTCPSGGPNAGEFQCIGPPEKGKPIAPCS